MLTGALHLPGGGTGAEWGGLTQCAPVPGTFHSGKRQRCSGWAARRRLRPRVPCPVVRRPGPGRREWARSIRVGSCLELGSLARRVSPRGAPGEGEPAAATSVRVRLLGPRGRGGRHGRLGGWLAVSSGVWAATPCHTPRRGRPTDREANLSGPAGCRRPGVFLPAG